ncbi:MAG: type II toxin-antitoxin system RelE/ParE family toxin [Bacteroidales bacterium]|nr:type II toxin-antitoxin system RelE/ParE family toxin [Bacteroidales bacterium]
MKKYKVKIEPEALADIQEITDWYNEAQAGLGKRLQETAIKHINSLNKDPRLFAIRYNEIRCIVIKKFPYMVHFYINDANHTVEVLAVISTDRNPKLWEEKAVKKA